MAIETRSYGEAATWEPDRLRLRPLQVLVGWLVAAASLAVAAWVLPGFGLDTTGAAFAGAAAIAVLNAVLPPILAALRLPFMVAIGFLLVLFADAWLLMLAADILPHDIRVDSFGDAFLAALLMAAVSLSLQVILGTDDDSEYAMRVTRRVARRQGEQVRTDVPGIIYLEIDGLALPVLRDAMRDGNAPTMARWIAEDGYRLIEWETDLSSQTGASQAGILLGSNHDIPAFRWVEKATGRVIACSSPSDCAEIEGRLASGIGLLTDGGASRGNLLSGEAAEAILTVSRTEAEKKANPGYRAFLANGFNVTRTFVLFLFEIVLEVTAALRAARRDVRPRGHRGGIYPLMRAAMCVFVRDLIVYAVLTDMMRGRPAVYATFSSYDEVAHHSGLMRADTLEALRKLDKQFERLERARRYAPRPYEIVVLSDHGQTQGATFKQRNGYGLDELVDRSLGRENVVALTGGDEQDAMVKHAMGEATGRIGEAVQVRRLRARRRGPGLGQPRPRLPDGAAAAAHARGDRGAPSRAAARPARAPARGLGARPLLRARRRRARRRRRSLPRRGSRRGRGPARALLPHRGAAPAAHGSLQQRRRHHGRLVLRRRARRGLRVRGADLVPRRARRPADAAVHPRPAERRAADGAAGRRRRGPRPPARVAAGASGARGRPAPGAGCGAEARGRSSRAGST